jgi:hypothetical protein
VATDAPNSPTNAQVFLGLFIVGQVLFLVAANLLGMADRARPYLKEEPADAARHTLEGEVQHGTRLVAEQVAPDWVREQGHVFDATQTAGGIVSRWAQVTAQPQDWSLFSPGVSHVTTFVAVEFRWDDDRLPERQLPPRVALVAAAGPLSGANIALAVRAAEATWPALPPRLLLSENEPRDLRSFFRIGHFRLRRYEGTFDLTLSPSDDKVDERRADGWRRQIEDKVRMDWPEMRAYLRWRLDHLRERWPDLPTPTQARLLIRIYHIPPPGQPAPAGFWSGPDHRPLARWLPGAPEPADYLPVEAYNPVVDRFERLREKSP